jgi:hypothetical protein
MKRVILGLLFAVLMVGAASADVDDSDTITVTITIAQEIDFEITDSTFNGTITLADQVAGEKTFEDAFSYTCNSNSDWYSRTTIQNVSWNGNLSPVNTWTLHLDGPQGWYSVDILDGATVGPSSTPLDAGEWAGTHDARIANLDPADGYGSVNFDVFEEVSFDDSF